VTRAVLVERAARIADADGLEALTLARLARELGVKPPSLFDHIDGRTGLTAALRARSFEEQGRIVRAAASGRSKDDAVRAIAGAYREFVRTHPGLYRASVRTFVGDFPEVARTAQDLLEAFLDALRGYGIRREESVHAARFARSTLHGFLMLELDRGFCLGPDVDLSFDRAVDGACAVLAHWPPAGSRPAGSGPEGRADRPRRSRRPARSESDGRAPAGRQGQVRSTDRRRGTRSA
jgi:AcrR family transcriptional regulator